ncbi:MAG: hypothetical protein L6R39_005242 [Caloplaca ligustica]|nr:MAG: hypothetical protein L6R39_005242 [Caloplaca ligustica]
MRVPVAFSISFFLTLGCAISLQDIKHGNGVSEKRWVMDRVVARQEDPTATISTIGILPNAGQLGTGTPSLGGHSLTGHGPAIQPQPGSSAAGNGTNTDTTVVGSNETAHLEVTDYQYTYNSRPRVDITLKYGSKHITQTWEVRDGKIELVQPMGTGNPSINGTGTLEGSVFGNNGSTNAAPAGTWDDSSIFPNGDPSSPVPSGTSGGNTTGTSSGANVGSGTGTPPPRQERPSGVRPGFTGPKRKVRRERLHGEDISHG